MVTLWMIDPHGRPVEYDDVDAWPDIGAVMYREFDHIYRVDVGTTGGLTCRSCRDDDCRHVRAARDVVDGALEGDHAE
jgi:hypothetical protein